MVCEDNNCDAGGAGECDGVVAIGRDLRGQRRLVMRNAAARESVVSLTQSIQVNKVWAAY